MRKYLIAAAILCGILTGCASPGTMGMSEASSNQGYSDTH